MKKMTFVGEKDEKLVAEISLNLPEKKSTDKLVDINSVQVELVLKPIASMTVGQLYTGVGHFLGSDLRATDTEVTVDRLDQEGCVKVTSSLSELNVIFEVFLTRGLFSKALSESINKYLGAQTDVIKAKAVSLGKFNGAGKAMAVHGICSAARVSEVVPEVAPQVGPQTDQSYGNGKGAACSRVTAV